jgi:capsular exopolysaccharide synthesis family protein
MSETPHRNLILERVREIQESGDSGFLSLEKGGQTVVVQFRDGLINAVSTNIKKHQLGQYLVMRDYLDEKELGALVEESRKQKALLGETAVSKTLLEDAELVEVIQTQAVQALTHAIKSDFEVNNFNRTVPPAIYMPGRMDHTHLLLELARNNLQPFKLNPAMLITLRNGKPIPPLPWYPAELSVLSELKAPKTIHELAVATGLEYPRLSKILFVLDSLNLIGHVESAPSETTALVRRDGFPYESLVPEIRRTGLSDKLESVRDENSFVSEQFKTLKVYLNEASASRGVKVITVTSPDSRDGKSLICTNLAVSLSHDAKRKVILLDCDFRNPHIHKFLGITNEPGLQGYLEDDSLQSYCYMRRLDKLYILTAGGVASNPVELLSLDKMSSLIAYLKIEFDTIIIDSPPLGPISDSQILSGISDALLLVIRSGKTSYRSLEAGLRKLDRSKLLGMVFNDVKPMLFNTHYNYRYYQYGKPGQYPYGQHRKTHHRPKTYFEK